MIVIRMGAKFENAKTLEKRIISPAKLMNGGLAIFAAAKRNHQRVIEGKKDIIPLVMNILRE